MTCGAVEQDGANSLIFVVFISFFLFAIVRIIMLRLPIPLPQNFAISLIGVFFGFMHGRGFIKVDIEFLSKLDPRVAMDFVLPVTMFMGGFFVNKEVFQKPGLHIMLFLILNYGICLSGLAWIVALMTEWPMRDAAFMLCIVLPPGPILARTFLKRLTVSYKLETFLVGEALLSNVIAYGLFSLLAFYNVQESVGIPYDDILYSVLFGPLLGFIAAKLVTYWLTRIIKDIVNSVNIVIASIYFTFILCQISHISSILAMVVMGVYMGGRQTNMEEQNEDDIIRILNVMANFFNCNLFISTGLHLYTHGSDFFTGWDIFNIIMIFLMMATVRFAVVLTLSQILHYGGFCLSANNLLVLCTCNIRGSLSIMMSFFIIIKDFPVTYPNKVFPYALMQMLLSQFFNVVVSNLVIRYDVLAQYDESRERFISTIMDILDGIRYRSLSANRHGNLSFADADWHTVSKFTELKHPLIALPVISQASATTITPEQEESRSIRRILTIAKCSYKKQYNEGLMSRNALSLLTQWTSHALAKGGNLIAPTKIASVLTIPQFYILLLKNLGQRYKDLSVKRSNCDIRRICAVLIYTLDSVFSVLALTNVLMTDHQDRTDFFFAYNIIFIALHSCWIFFKVMIMKKIDVWDMWIIPIVIVGVIDLIVFKSFYESTVVGRALRATCVLTRFIRPFRLAGSFLLSLKPLMFTCDRMVSHKLMDGYDIGRSYIQARLEVVRLISHVEDVPTHLRENYKSDLKLHKIEAVKMLGVMQLHCPSTLTTAKTRQATRIVLKRQEYIVRSIQKSRALGEDGSILEKMILTRMASINMGHIKITHPDYFDIVMNVPWIKDSNEIFMQVMEKGEQVNFKKYEIIVAAYENPGGIFIILEGLAWVIRGDMLAGQKQSLDMVTVDYLSSGSVIGEFTFLTGKPRHKTIGCYTDVMGLYVRNKVLYDMMGGRPNPTRTRLFNLEERMWRVVALRIALRLLMGEPAWLPWSQSQIMMRLVDSVLVDGSDTDRTFNEWVAEYEIVLIQGQLTGLSSDEPLTAPAYIPQQRATYAFMEYNPQRTIMLAIPPVEECDLHVSTYDNPQQQPLIRPSPSECTFSSGSSNYQPCWQARRKSTKLDMSSVFAAASEATTHASRFEMSFGRRALRSLSFPFTALLRQSFEAPLVNMSRVAHSNLTQSTNASRTSLSHLSLR